MGKALVLGGNNYFGLKLVQNLLANGYEVTLLNRGTKQDPFGDNVERINCDRDDLSKFINSINKTYDVVFDQCCFDYNQAKNACEVFKGKVQKYIFTSSVSVYHYGSNLKEESLDLNQIPLNKLETTQSNYGLAKAQAEKAFLDFASFPITSVRLPIVLDSQDTTKRLQFDVRSIKEGKEVYFTNLKAKMSFISAEDAAYALFWLAEQSFYGAINIASPKAITLKSLVEIIEDKTGKKLVLRDDKNNVSSYNIKQDWFLDCSKVSSLGLRLKEVHSYLPGMVEEILLQNC